MMYATPTRTFSVEKNTFARQRVRQTYLSRGQGGGEVREPPWGHRS